MHSAGGSQTTTADLKHSEAMQAAMEVVGTKQRCNSNDQLPRLRYPRETFLGNQSALINGNPKGKV